MKNVFQFLCTALLIAMSVSCSKEEINIEDTLEGTKWQITWKDTKGIIEFTSETDVKIYEADDNLTCTDYLKIGKYSYKDGKITFYDNELFVVDMYHRNKIWFYYYLQTATFNSDKMTVEATGEKFVVDDYTGDITTTELNLSILRFIKVK